MRGQWVIRGVPDSIRNDGWWLSETAEPKTTHHAPFNRRWGRLDPAPAGAVVVLVAIADVLLWQGHLGVSVALFALAVSVCIMAFKPGGAVRHEWSFALLFTVICNLPVIEQVQLLSLLFSALGIVGLLLWSAEQRIISAAQAYHIWFRATTVGAATLPALAIHEVRGKEIGWDMGRIVRSAALPLSVGLVFLVLFTIANPLVEETLDQVTRIDLLEPGDVLRLIFWVVLACALWPYLNTQAPWRGTMPGKLHMPTMTGGPLAQLINPSSVRNSLVLFNAMFLLQTLSDLAVLTGGVALPDGLSYAEYAHRGAYPLIATALLAGVFAIATHHMSAQSKLMRVLMYLWLAQNLFLVLTAVFRLSLYVEAYTLTYLRIAAFIWMGLVFVGLVLTLVYIIQKRPLGWLIRWNVVALVVTLYVCCFVNFAYLITDYNLSNQNAGARLDLRYLCSMGEQAIPAMMEYGQVTDNVACGRGSLPALQFDPIDDWREWGFRRWRLQTYLGAHHDL